MARRMKVFLPRWVLRVIYPILAVVWGVVTYLTFVLPRGPDNPGLLGWLGMTAILVLVGVMMWLMTGRLPAYLIEMDEEGDSNSR